MERRRGEERTVLGEHHRGRRVVSGQLSLLSLVGEHASVGKVRLLEIGELELTPRHRQRLAGAAAAHLGLLDDLSRGHAHYEDGDEKADDDEEEQHDALLEQALLALRRLLGLDEGDELGEGHDTAAVGVDLAELLDRLVAEGLPPADVDGDAGLGSVADADVLDHALQ